MVKGDIVSKGGKVNEDIVREGKVKEVIVSKEGEGEGSYSK